VPFPELNGSGYIYTMTLNGYAQNKESGEATVFTTYFPGDVYARVKSRVSVGRWIPKKSKACLNANVLRKKKHSEKK
jgi:hypothetical protein